ncbi:MAG: hypothetical protein IJT19_05770 [Bacteroidaceae bacterium]|nr:hypothetical protein [Bacteroidaceae bacterium]
MKKTKFWSLLALCFCLVGAMTFTACGDDENDDPVNSGGQVDKSIVGDWVLPDSLNNPFHNPQYHFEANGTGYFQMTMESESTDYLGDGTEVTHTWKQIERRGGNFTYKDEVVAFTYTYFENTFYEDGKQSDYHKEEFPREEWFTDSIAPVVIRNNVMYIGSTPWVKK